MMTVTDTEHAPLALPDVTGRLAEIYADAERELRAILAEGPVMREVAELEASIVATNCELAAVDAAPTDDDAEAAKMLGRGVILRRRLDTLIELRLSMADALARENEALRVRLSAVTTRGQRMVDADRAAVLALAQRLEAWHAPRVPMQESRP